LIIITYKYGKSKNNFKIVDKIHICIDLQINFI